MKTWIKFAEIYVVASVFIGPGIVFLLGGNHPSGWDCTDSSWPDSVSLAERESIYEHGSRFMGPAAIIMLLVGIIILSGLLYFGAKNRTVRVALRSLFVVFMLLGYGLITLFATSKWC